MGSKGYIWLPGMGGGERGGMRQCQIRARFESGVKTKFLAALNQLLKSFFHCHDIPWSHSFPKRYDMYIVKNNG